MANEAEFLWGSLDTSLTVTNLQSLDDGEVWYSDQQTQTTTAAMKLRVFYDLEYLSTDTPTAGDNIIFRLAAGDGTNIDGNVPASQGHTATAALVAEYQAGCRRVHTHHYATSAAKTLTGHFDIDDPPMYWTLVIENDSDSPSELESTNQAISFKYGSPQYQTT